MTLQTTLPEIASDSHAVPRQPLLARSVPAAPALLCALLCVWAVQHPCYGLIHDSQIYLIQALARLDPQSFSNDIFLRYGSQDRFTVFSPLFAAAIRMFGAETAGVVLTLVAQASFFAVLAVFARMLMPARLVWLGLALVCALPGFYGGGNVFSLVEDFATPRLFAETLVLAGLVAFLKRRFWIAALFAVVGTVVHPLMTAGGVFVALCMSTTPPRVRGWAFAGGTLAGCALLGWMAARGGQVIYDHEWLRLLQWGITYLWPSQWNIRTWSPTLVTLSTLAIGVLVLERSHARSLCTAALIAGLAGIVLNYVGGDLLHIVLVVQVQPYRWLWLSTVVAFVLVPLIAYRLWSRGGLGRTAVLLLVATWLFMSDAYGIGTALLAILAAAAAMKRNEPLPARTQRLVTLGASAVLALAVIYHVATILLFTAIADISEVPKLMQDIRALSRSGVLTFTIFVLIFFAVGHFKSRAQRLSLTAACVVLLAMLAPISVREWQSRWYDRDYGAFAEWRALIPAGTEVLWFDSPTSAWMLLQRPSHLSNMQEASGVFSRAAAMAMKKRVDMLEPYLASETNAAWREKKKDADADIARESGNPIPLASLCAGAPDLRFVVTRKNMVGEPIALTPDGVSARYHDLRLYRCDPPRS